MEGLSFKTELRAILIRPDGTSFDYGVLSSSGLSIPVWRRIYEAMKRRREIPLGMTFLAFLAVALHKDPLALFAFGMVTTAGVNYLAADFRGTSAARINAFKYHHSGTGTTAAAVGNTALATPTAGARVAGTQTNPQAGKYMVQATIPYTSALSITEWGAFSAPTAGTLWDRKVFAARATTNGSSIAWSYTLTVNAGG